MRCILKSSLILLSAQAPALQAAVTVTNISAGHFHSLFLESDGSLWATGLNNYGQLGDGTSHNTNRPERIVSPNVIAVSGGGLHTLFLKSGGSLWGMGNNECGQLGFPEALGIPGIETPQAVMSYHPIAAITNVIAIAAGGLHSLFIKTNGSLWAMGSDQLGQLGGGNTNTDLNYPAQIVASNVVAIAAGNDHSLFIKSDGSLWGMGYNADGELGDGTTNNAYAPEQIVASNVVAIAAGDGHSLFLKSDGSLWGMGNNWYGQLGDGTLNNVTLPEQIVSSNVVAMAAGSTHSLFLKSDGSLWGMGNNWYGQLGDGTSGFLINNDTNEPEQIVPSNVVAISAGTYHNLFLKSDGSLWAIGLNDPSFGLSYSGDLGDGFTNSISPFPEQIVRSPQPILTGCVSSGSNLQLAATCQFGGTFYLLAGTNLNQPVSQWVPVATNTINNRANNNFTATVTNAVNSSVGQQFYILQSP